MSSSSEVMVGLSTPTKCSETNFELMEHSMRPLLHILQNRMAWQNRWTKCYLLLQMPCWKSQNFQSLSRLMQWPLLPMLLHEVQPLEPMERSPTKSSSTNLLIPPPSGYLDVRHMPTYQRNNKEESSNHMEGNASWLDTCIGSKPTNSST